MHALQSILLATDFRPASLDTTKVVADLAAAFGARTTLFHVFQPFGRTAARRGEERALAQWQLQQVAQRLTDNVDIAEAAVVEGHPADRIVCKAQEMEADLVLIGAGKWTRHRDPFAPGPIAQAILERCTRSVLAVRPGPPSVSFKKILCPVDQSQASERALQTAINLAQVFYGTIHIVTVVPESSWLSAFAETGKLAGALAEHKQHWRQEFEQFLGSFDFHGVPWRREIRHGVPHTEIVASAREHQSGLIVMGSTGRTGLARLLIGSVARRVLQELPCSLWSVRQEELAEQLFEEDLRHIQLLMAEGREFLQARDYRSALFKFRQVLTYNPFHADAVAGQADVYERLGQRERAARCRHRAESVRRSLEVYKSEK
jgi:nucleotide-binding universal stress UspA family protein